LTRVNTPTTEAAKGAAAQGGFNFEAQSTNDGHTRWLEGRQLAARELAWQLHLPVGHQVEVWLFGGVRLRGQLRLREELPFVEEERVRHMELMVDRVAFA
jgi:hypothetical protein